MFAALAILLCTSSCEKKPINKASGTYLGGEIVNPKDNHVSIYKDGVLMDSIILNANNRFIYEFKEDFDPGIYTFVHKEGQIAHIEEGDSIMFRLNTVQFDESLSFSGFGKDRNNLLIDFFLMWEEENKNLPDDFYQRSPEVFAKSLDSMERLRRKKLNRFYEKYQPSAEFRKIAEAVVTFDNYQRKESYPFSHYGKHKLTFIEELPSDFYSFRESVNLNEEDLYTLHAYRRYLYYFMDHQAYLKYGAQKSYNASSYIHNKYEIDIIDSLISSQRIKDRLLGRVAFNFMASSNNKAEVDRIFERFNQCITSPRVQRRIQEMYDDYSLTAAGAPIPDQMLVDIESRMVTLSSTIVKPTVLYFWSYENHDHMDNSHRKVNELHEKYPEYQFIGINTDRDSQRWKRMVKQHKFNPAMEFQFKDKPTAIKQLSIYGPTKTIILDKKGRIIDSHANLYRTTFENQLLEHLNK